MTRNQLQNELRRLGFKNLCDDDKTLVAYNQIQYYLYANHTPIKAVDSVYLDGDDLRVIIYGYDDDAGYSLLDEVNA